MKIQLKRSDVLEGGKAKKPTSANMKDGELAINYNSIDPSFFIKDTNGDIRKLSLVDTENVQSDWGETNPNSPSYIKNKQLVTQEISELESIVNTKIGDAPIDNYMYGRVNSTWQRVEVTEAAKDGNGYVRKDGAWYAIENYGYATEAYATGEAQAAALIAVSTAKDYTDTEIQKIVDDINGANVVTEAPETGGPYARQAKQWVEIDTSDVELPTNLVYTNQNNLITGRTEFRNSLKITNDDNYIEGGRLKLKNNGWIYTDNDNAGYDFGQNVAIRRESRGFTARQNNRGGSGGPSGTGGLRVEFIDQGDNIKVGIRNDDPEVALHVSSAIKANQYQDALRSNADRANFDGTLFVSPLGYDFTNTIRFHDDVFQEAPSYHKIDDAPFTALASISSNERAAATRIRTALRGYVKNGKRKFSVDKQSLVAAFTDSGLDINDYDILKDITQPSHPGFKEPDIDLDVAGFEAATYSAVNYENLFAFLLAAGPDLSALEARIAALENA